MTKTYCISILDFVGMRELDSQIMREIEERIGRPVSLEQIQRPYDWGKIND